MPTVPATGRGATTNPSSPARARPKTPFTAIAQGNRPHRQPRPERNPTCHRSRPKRCRETEKRREYESTSVRLVERGVRQTERDVQRRPRSPPPTAESPPNTSSHPKTIERTRRSVGTTRARRGIEPEMPDERGTSSSCSVCGHEDKDSRGERGLWKCDRCGVVVHGDVNGADNIRQETRTVTPPLGSEDSGNGCLAQPRVIQFDRTRGFQPRDSRTGATKP